MIELRNHLRHRLFTALRYTAVRYTFDPGINAYLVASWTLAFVASVPLAVFSRARGVLASLAARNTRSDMEKEKQTASLQRLYKSTYFVHLEDVCHAVRLGK